MFIYLLTFHKKKTSNNDELVASLKVQLEEAQKKIEDLEKKLSGANPTGGGGVGSGGCQDSAASANNPHPNRSPEGAGLNTDHDLRWNDKAVHVL